LGPYLHKIDVISGYVLLRRRFGDKFECMSGAARNACRFSIRPAFFAPEWGVDTKIAFGRFFLVRIPNRPMRTLRTRLDAFPAANAFGLVDYPDIAMFRINVRGANRAILDAKWGNALTAWCNNNVERILRE
jgi:hypothetical protein